ncbi:hypothetical protein [Burkholderia glumae]|uniref:hypothetical protein n=1 Tax=Burkholderia glumae TaxID=337 RepID=UPI0020CDEEF9|nr:hypothetical protein [Burkholderia glumae]MCQ0032553.1 hypothetical protein [Burkholderia glumae]MCQ0035809.1 hypothetical protein [Burkholderia glumae]
MTININISFTNAALEAHPNVDTQSFSYQSGIPFPQTGDYIELPAGGSIAVFVVSERVFAFSATDLNLRVLLDVVR